VSEPAVFFLDTLPFDWARPEARRLHAVLAAVFPLRGPVIEMARAAGIPPAAVAWNHPMRSVWFELIDTARNRGRLRELLAEASAVSRLAAVALEDLGCAGLAGPESSGPDGPGRDVLTARDIAVALAGFYPEAVRGDLEEFGRRLLAEVCSALRHGHLVCVAERAPDGLRPVVVLDPGESLLVRPPGGTSSAEERGGGVRAVRDP
jgi:hypothetical protein